MQHAVASGTPRRLVRASTRTRRLHGSGEPAPDRGVLYSFEEVGPREALLAFDAVAREPGAFEIITRDRTRVAFAFGRGGLRGILDRFLGRTTDRVTLDMWFEEEPDPPLVDVYAVSLLSARVFVDEVYRDVADRDLWRLLGVPQLDA